MQLKPEIMKREFLVMEIMYTDNSIVWTIHL